jgi:hypothetical protein
MYGANRVQIHHTTFITAAGTIRYIEKKIHLIGTRFRDLPVCSIVLQLTTLPCERDGITFFIIISGVGLLVLRPQLAYCTSPG